MRNLAQRHELAAVVLEELLSKTDTILQSGDLPDRVKAARSLYNSARSASWFQPVISAMKSLAGPGEFCMYCSANEPSHIDHHYPLSVFPDVAMSYENFLWVCSICNSTHKGDRFPPHNIEGDQILDPVADNVWDYFLIETQFGNLIPRVDPATLEPLGRAVSTCTIVALDRENVQMRRRGRFADLVTGVSSLTMEIKAGNISKSDAELKVQQMINHPFQVDVADFFLVGPGKSSSPFRELFLELQD